jgi:REP element-mobilizing transposase RayT
MQERKHRLDPKQYIGRVRVTFTVCIKNKAKLFISDEIVNEFIINLKSANNKHGIINWCYIFMPEHVHILNEGRNEESDLLKGMNLFKQYCGYYLANKKIGIELQRDYYDHIHRKEEDLIKQIRYILENPVRKGLVEGWRDYKYKGSLDYRLEDMIT